MPEEAAPSEFNYIVAPLQRDEWFISCKRVGIIRGEGEMKRNIGKAWSLIWSQVVSGRGEYARLI